MTDSSDLILEDNPQPHVRRFTINRPDKRNALSTPTLSELVERVVEADANPNVRAIIVTGGTKIFAAGADINELAIRKMPETFVDPRPTLWSQLRRTRTPIVAAIEGWCLGAGNELLLCADICVAGESARFGQPETNLGIIPGAGGCVILANRIGRSLAMKMVLMGEIVSAEMALSSGLISEVVDAGSANERALEVALKIAGRAPLALQNAKAAVNASFEMSQDGALSFERQAFSSLFATQDRAEGVAAFLEKREPKWSGK